MLFVTTLSGSTLNHCNACSNCIVMNIQIMNDRRYFLQSYFSKTIFINHLMINSRHTSFAHRHKARSTLSQNPQPEQAKKTQQSFYTSHLYNNTLSNLSYCRQSSFNPHLDLEVCSQGMQNDHWRPSIYMWLPIPPLQVCVSSNTYNIAPTV